MALGLNARPREGVGGGQRTGGEAGEGEGRTVEKAHAQRRCKQGREKNMEGFL